MRFSMLPLSGLVTSGVATNLYVSSYAGTITTLQLRQSAGGSYSLNSVAVNHGSAPSPSWLTLNEDIGVVYCLDEGNTSPTGSIATYSTSPSGELTQINRQSVISGPVSSVVYNGGNALAAAH
jgi:Lactonase, 7-bladed beta-propeller